MCPNDLLIIAGASSYSLLDRGIRRGALAKGRENNDADDDESVLKGDDAGTGFGSSGTIS